VSFDFTIEIFVFIHKLFLFGVRMCLSHSIGVDIHGMSSLRGSMWSGSFVSSILVTFPLVLLGCQSEGFIKSLFLLTELRGGQPLLVGFSGLFFLFLESPWNVHVWIKVWGMYDCSGEWWFHGMFEGFNSSLVI